jgi:transcriptional regulator with XRE-family HTH domain
LSFCRVSIKATKPVALPYPDTLETIGDHLKTRRLDLGLYQKDVARQLGVKTETVTNWEKNYTAPQLYLIPRVIVFLGYDPVEDESDTLSLGERVLRARKRLGMTQKDLARQLGVDPGTLTHWEHGRRRPMPENRAKLESFVMSGSVGGRLVIPAPGN